jgi:hypothetical protein
LLHTCRSSQGWSVLAGFPVYSTQTHHPTKRRSAADCPHSAKKSHLWVLLERRLLAIPRVHPQGRPRREPFPLLAPIQVPTVCAAWEAWEPCIDMKALSPAARIHLGPTRRLQLLQASSQRWRFVQDRISCGGPFICSRSRCDRLGSSRLRWTSRLGRLRRLLRRRLGGCRADSTKHVTNNRSKQSECRSYLVIAVSRRDQNERTENDCDNNHDAAYILPRV